jgi:CDP-paratose 2-epimerase
MFRQEFPSAKICAFDNLKRRGSEINLKDFRELSIDFVHGDIRKSSDFDELDGTFDLIVEASAEPSVHAGTSGKSPQYLLETNLFGTLNCLEYARNKTAAMIFLSTSRVYSIKALRQIPLKVTGKRLDLDGSDFCQGLTYDGINEHFATVGQGARSLYGATKLASEIFIEEYAEQFGYPVVINRCGVIAGPGQFGKVDQGVFTLWVARHLFGGDLKYQGFGGQGHQVRDLLHPQDLFKLILKQMHGVANVSGQLFAVGGGRSGAVSLAEYTDFCEAATGRKISIGSKDDTAAVDIPFFVTDSKHAQNVFGWRQEKSPADIVADIVAWLDSNQSLLKPLFT